MSDRGVGFKDSAQPPSTLEERLRLGEFFSVAELLDICRPFRFSVLIAALMGLGTGLVFAMVSEPWGYNSEVVFAQGNDEQPLVGRDKLRDEIQMIQERPNLLDAYTTSFVTELKDIGKRGDASSISAQRVLDFLEMRVQREGRQGGSVNDLAAAITRDLAASLSGSAKLGYNPLNKFLLRVAPQERGGWSFIVRTPQSGMALAATEALAKSFIAATKALNTERLGLITVGWDRQLQRLRKASELVKANYTAEVNSFSVRRARVESDFYDISHAVRALEHRGGRKIIRQPTEEYYTPWSMSQAEDRRYRVLGRREVDDLRGRVLAIPVSAVVGKQGILDTFAKINSIEQAAAELSYELRSAGGVIDLTNAKLIEAKANVAGLVGISQFTVSVPIFSKEALARQAAQGALDRHGFGVAPWGVAGAAIGGLSMLLWQIVALFLRRRFGRVFQ